MIKGFILALFLSMVFFYLIVPAEDSASSYPQAEITQPTLPYDQGSEKVQTYLILTDAVAGTNWADAALSTSAFLLALILTSSLIQFFLEQPFFTILRMSASLRRLLRSNVIPFSKKYFTIFDAGQRTPISRAEISLIDHDIIKLTQHADARGRVFFVGPFDSPVTIRVSKKGYHSQSVTFNEEIFDVALEPLPSEVSSELEGITLRLLYQVKVVSLILGTMLLVPLLFVRLDQITSIVIIGYIIFWMSQLHTQSRPYLLAQIVNSITGKGIAHARISLYGPRGEGKIVSNRDGFIRIPYPLPHMVSINKEGYTSMQKQAIPATAITSDTLLFNIHPSSEK